MGWCSQTGSSRHPDRRDTGIGRGPGTFDEPLPELGAPFVVHRVRSPGRNRLPVPPVSVTRPMVALAWSKPSRRRRHRVPLRTTPDPERPARRRRSGPRRQAVLLRLGEPATPRTRTGRLPAAGLHRGPRPHDHRHQPGPLWLSRPRAGQRFRPAHLSALNEIGVPVAAARGPPPDNSSLRCPLPRARTLSATTTTPAPASSERPAPRRPIRTVTSGLGSSGNRRRAHTVPSHHLLGASGRPGPEVVAAA